MNRSDRSTNCVYSKVCPFYRTVASPSFIPVGSIKNIPKSTKHEKAGAAVQAAIKRGKLPHVSLLDCVDCGAQAQEYHHHKGYGKGHRLDVIPLCKTCHLTRHGKKRSELSQAEIEIAIQTYKDTGSIRQSALAVRDTTGGVTFYKVKDVLEREGLL